MFVCLDSATLWIVAHQASLSVGFSRQEYWKHWSVLPFPTPGDLPDTVIKLRSLVSPALYNCTSRETPIHDLL